MTVLLLSALFSGAVAIAVTRAVERFGGVVGGLLGTLPTTIVPASLGIWAANPSADAFQAAMGMVPPGMLLNAAFLWLWRVVPPLLPDLTLRARLVTMIVVSLSAWLLAAAATMGSARLAVQQGVPPLMLGVVGLGVGLAFGLWAAWGQRAAPRGRNPVGWSTLAVRGALAALAIGFSVALAQSGIPMLAGTASVFPAIFLTTMAGLWLSQGEAVPAGAVGPMMLGATSVSAFAVLAAVMVPTLGALAGTTLAWVIAVVGVTAPSAWWLRRPAKVAAT